MAEDKTSLILDIDRGANVTAQKTVTYVNPEATNTELLNFAQGMVGLSTDTLDKVTRVNRQEITEHNYSIYGPTNINAQFNVEGDPESAVYLNNYCVIDETTNEPQTATFTTEASSVDSSKAYLHVETSEAANGYAMISAYNQVNEYSEARVTISAAGEFGTLSKICTIKFFTARE